MNHAPWRSTKLWCLAATSLVLAGCDGITAPARDEGAPLQTDRLSYQLQLDRNGDLTTRIPFTYHNSTGDTVYLVNCKGLVPPSLEKWQNGDWVPAWGAIVPACLSPPIEVAPGEDFEYTLQVNAARQGSNVQPQFRVADLAGIYRLVWSVPVHHYDAYNAHLGTPLPLKDRISNRFNLRMSLQWQILDAPAP